MPPAPIVPEPSRTLRVSKCPVTVTRRLRLVTLRSRVDIRTVAGQARQPSRGITSADSNWTLSIRSR